MAIQPILPHSVITIQKIAFQTSVNKFNGWLELHYDHPYALCRVMAINPDTQKSECILVTPYDHIGLQTSQNPKEIFAALLQYIQSLGIRKTTLDELGIPSTAELATQIILWAPKN